MLVLLTKLAFAEAPTEDTVRKELPVRIGLCAGNIDCPSVGIKTVIPQAWNENFGISTSIDLLGVRHGVSYHFSVEDKAFDPNISLDYRYSWSDSTFSGNFGVHHGANWRFSEKHPLFLDYQIGCYLDPHQSNNKCQPSISVSLLWGRGYFTELADFFTP